MDGAEVNEKVRSIAVDADDAGEQEASSAVTENSRCSFESDDDRLKPKNVERAEKEEAARFLEETAQKALVTEEARSATVAELRSIAHAALDAPISSIPLESNKTRGEVSKATQPPLESREASVASEACQEITPVPLGPTVEEERVAISDLKPNTTSTGTAENNDPAENRSMDRDIVSNGQSTEIDLPSTAIDTIEERLQTCSGADGAIELTKKVMVEKDLARLPQESRRQESGDGGTSPPAAERTNRQAAAELDSPAKATDLVKDEEEAVGATRAGGQNETDDLSQSMATFDDDERTDSDGSVYTSGTPASLESAAEIDASQSPDSGSLIRSSIGGCDGSVATSSVEGTVVDCARSESAQASPVSVQSRVVADNLNPASALVVSTELTSLHGSVNGARGKSTHASPVLVESRVVADYLNGASSTLVLTELARLRGGDDCARHKFAQGPPVSIESRVVADYLANASHSMVIAGLVDLHTSTHSSTPEHARTPTVEREDTPTPAAGLAKPSECSLVAASTVSAQDRDDAQATQAQERNNASIASKAIHRDSVEVPALENTFQQIFNHPITENTDADAAARDDQSANPEVLAAPCFEDASSSSRAVALLGEDCGAAVPDLIAAESLVSTAPEVLGTLADEGGAGLNKDFADGTHVQGAPGLPLSVEARALVDDIILSSVTTVAAVVAADARDKRCTRKILGSNDLRKGSNAPLLGTPPLDNTRKTNAKPVLPVEQLKPTSRPEVFLAPRVENAVGSSNTLLAKQHESPTTSFVAQVNHLESSAVACVVVEGGVVAKSANGGVGRVQFEFPPDSSVAATTDVAADYVDHTMREALTAVSQVLGASDTPKDATGTHLTMGQAFLRQAVQDPTAPATPAFEPSGTLPTTTIGAENGLTLVRAGEMRGTETDIVEEQRRGDIVDGRNPPSALCLEAFVVGDYLAVAYGTIAMLEVPTLIENKPMGLDEHKPMGLDEHGGPEGQRRSSPLLPKDDLVISPAALPLESRDVQDIIPCAPAPTANMAVSRPTPPEKESALTCASLMPSSVDERYCDSTHRDDLIGADVQSSNYVSASHQSETEEIRVSRDTPDGPSCATLQNAVVADYMSDAVRSLLVAEMNTTWSSLRTCQGIAALNVCENQTITSPFLQYPVANPTRESTDGRSKPNTDQDSDPVSETHVLSSAEAITPKLRVNEEEQYFGIAPHDLGRAQVQNRDGQNGVEEQSKSVCPLAAPIPPGTRREETHDNIDAQRQPESKQNPVDRRHPHPPVEALPWSQENGGGAKMRDNSDVGNATWALENLGQENTTGSYLEAGEWLREVGVWTKSLEDGMMRAHADAISWLQEAGRRAKAVQDEAVKARADAASWLREAGGQAKSLQATVAGAHSEAAAWLQGVGARAMFLQEKTDGVRLDAVAWLTTRGAMELDREKISERSAVASERQTNGTDVHLHAKAESINLNNFNQPTKDCSIQVKGSTQDDDKEGFAARRSRQENEPSAVAITEYCEVAGNSKEAVLANSDKETIIPYSAGVYTTDDGSAYTCAPPSQTTDSAALSENCAKPPADSLTLVERTAPDTWLEPATAPLGREGSAAPTESGAGQMLNAGETEWSRVSLSRTPPFDALNSPSLALRWAPAGARPRPLAADLECIKDTVASADTANKSPDSGAAATAAVNGRAVLSPNAGGLGWMDFFAPPHRMAPIGDAYGIDSFRSAEASASTTIRGDSTGSFMPSHASNGTDDGRARRQSYNQTWRWSDGSEESWGLGEVQNPASEAKCRMRDQLGVCLEESGGGWGGAAEKTENSLLSARRICGKYRSKRWDKAAERSRQYIRRWETFLTRVHRHFDSEVQVRKRLSVIRRAHPDVSNEVAFVALAQSHGRASEAAAVLHLPRVKDEATLIATMLDVTSFVSLARHEAERQRRRRQLEELQGTTKHRPSQCSSHEIFQHQHLNNDHPHHQHNHQGLAQCTQQQQEQRHHRRGQQSRREKSALPNNVCACSDIHGVSRDASGNGGQRKEGVAVEQTGAPDSNPQVYRRERAIAAESSGSRDELQSRGSGSAPALLPPLVGLTDGTPPSPNTLKTVLSTSGSVALRIPKEFGLTPHVHDAVTKASVRGHGHNTTSGYVSRAKRATLGARARRQQQRMAKISAAGARCSGSSLDALAERFFRETSTLDRDSRYLDARLRGPKQGPAIGRRRGKGVCSNSSVSGSSWRESSSAVLMSVDSALGGGGGLSSTSSSGAVALAAGGDRGSCRVQNYFTQAGLVRAGRTMAGAVGR